jgi:hypothetical protein
MINPPKTIEEARQKKYNARAGNPKGWPYDEERCAYEVHSDFLSHQCSRKNGHGPAELYCKQHAKMV